jgi:hypothetical protein
MAESNFSSLRHAELVPASAGLQKSPSGSLGIVARACSGFAMADYPGVGFQDPQYFCDRLGILMRAMARRDDVFALRAVHV